MTILSRGSARDRAEFWADRINQSMYHKAGVTSHQDEYGTIWFLSVRGYNAFFQNAYAIGWFQRAPGHQGPQVKFLGGRAQGYGKNSKKIIQIRTIADLEAWVSIVCTFKDQ